MFAAARERPSTEASQIKVVSEVVVRLISPEVDARPSTALILPETTRPPDVLSWSSWLELDGFSTRFQSTNESETVQANVRVVPPTLASGCDGDGGARRQ